MLSMHDDEHYLFEALKAGASGYVLKREADQDLVGAVRAVGRGEAFLTNAAERSIIREWMDDGAEGPAIPLTPREEEVVKLIAEAYTNAQIAEILHLVGEDGRVAPRQRAAQARDARPGRARPLRDPARARRALRPGGAYHRSADARSRRPHRRASVSAEAARGSTWPRCGWTSSSGGRC